MSRTAMGNAPGPERRTTEMAPVPPGVAGATIVASSRVIPLVGAYAFAAFTAAAFVLYIICCPMLRILFTSQ